MPEPRNGSQITGKAMATIMLHEFGAEHLWRKYGEEYATKIAALAGEDTAALKARMTAAPADVPSSVTLKAGPGMTAIRPTTRA